MDSNQRKGGIVFALLGGLVAIGLAIFITGNAGYLWALILLGWGISRVSASDKPLFVGLVMCILYLALGGVIYFVADGVYYLLGAMVLIGWFANKIH